MTSQQSVCVIGCGRLGQRIIGCLAGHGLKVLAFDSNPDALRSIVTVAATDAEVLVRDGLTQNTSYVSNIQPAGSISEAVRDASLIIEAVSDNLALKRTIFREVVAACRPDAVLTTNSLNLGVNEIFSEVPYPEVSTLRWKEFVVF